MKFKNKAYTCLSWMFAVFMIYQQTNATLGVYWNKFAPVSEGACGVNNIKLLSLLNLLCNTTQTTSIQMRDACYGCFFRAGSILNGPTQLSSLNDCARLYITESRYATCATNLQAIVDGNRPTTDPVAGFCYTGYCDFVRCIRRINAQQLISTCYNESLGTRQLTLETDRIYFYTNITSCILARSRCSQYNPITGELQTNLIAPQAAVANKVSAVAAVASNGWIGGAQIVPQPPYFNSLQVSDTGELRVITFPTATTSVSDLFCSRLPNLQQSGFGTYNC
ncbi:uncharacterized protein LOC119662711 [Teleopsis dalmanni]|uniref:uncharacterized protein LOC119662711 n=1 Tax=Teleopsis dalmanni TaxID=139649 RepID=UPI0018CDAA26|nr:uncharacterized protein LOC119662711 [Teleopsis dalmanni]